MLTSAAAHTPSAPTRSNSIYGAKVACTAASTSWRCLRRWSRSWGSSGGTLRPPSRSSGACRWRRAGLPRIATARNDAVVAVASDGQVRRGRGHFRLLGADLPLGVGSAVLATTNVAVQHISSCGFAGDGGKFKNKRRVLRVFPPEIQPCRCARLSQSFSRTRMFPPVLYATPLLLFLVPAASQTKPLVGFFASVTCLFPSAMSFSVGE